MRIRWVAERLRRRSLIALLAVLLVGGGVAILTLQSDDDARPLTEATPKVASTSPTRFTPIRAREVGEPESLSIEAIGVDARVIKVGTAADGSQEVPTSIDDTGWWRDGIRPGRAGNAVIVGHTASEADGIFDDLGKLAPGDLIAVRSARGTLTFSVTRMVDVDVADFATIASEVYRVGGRPGLVLMTCGDFNGTTYDSTKIAFANLVER